MRHFLHLHLQALRLLDGSCLHPPSPLPPPEQPAPSAASASALPEDVPGAAMAEETTLRVGNPLHLQVEPWWEHLEMTNKLTQPVQHTVDGKLHLRMQCRNMPPYNWIERQTEEIKT